MIEPEEGWEGFTNTILMVGALAQNLAEEMMDDVSEEMLRRLTMNVELQTYRLAPLSPAYLAWKRRVGLDTRILIATKDYLKALQTLEPEKPPGRGVSYQPGDRLPNVRTWTVSPPEGTHEPSGLPYLALARRLEFGVASRNLPPRPHWRTAFRHTVMPSRFMWNMRNLGHKVERQLRTYIRKQKSRG